MNGEAQDERQRAIDAIRRRRADSELADFVARRLGEGSGKDNLAAELVGRGLDSKQARHFIKQGEHHGSSRQGDPQRRLARGPSLPPVSEPPRKRRRLVIGLLNFIGYVVAYLLLAGIVAAIGVGLVALFPLIFLLLIALVLCGRRPQPGHWGNGSGPDGAVREEQHLWQVQSTLVSWRE